jgi:LCP family protein required for cell wall assembly
MKQWDVIKPKHYPQNYPSYNNRNKHSFIKSAFKLFLTFTIIFLVSLYLDYLFETKLVISSDNQTEKKSAPSFSTSFAAAFVDFTFAKENPLEGELDGRINFLLMGIPGEKNPAPYLTDTIIFASFFPETKKVYLVSLPRDLLIKIPDQENYARINSLYLYGLIKKPGSPFDFIIQKTQEITGQKINYYALVDLNLFEQVIDLLGGVQVYLENDIYDPNFPGENFSYETFKMEKGLHTLDGKTAAKFVRSRHSTFGDFDRIKRQKQIIQSIIAKIQNLNPIFDFKTYIDLYQKFQNHFFTNLSYGDLKRLYSLVKDIRGKNIFEYSLGIQEPTNFLKEYNEGAYYLIPNEGIENYGKIKEFFASFEP